VKVELNKDDIVFYKSRNIVGFKIEDTVDITIPEEKIYSRKDLHNAYSSGIIRGKKIQSDLDYYSLCDHNNFEDWIKQNLQ